jgi:hypothetical protein
VTKVGKPVQQVTNMEFVEVVSDKKLKAFGITRGDVLMIAGFKQGVEKASDPYLTRKYAVVTRVVDEVVQIPDENNDYMTYVIDPRNVQGVGPERQSYYEGLLQKQYGT